MARGGKRQNAGRKVGALTKKTRAIAEQAIEGGMEPLEVMLENMRHFQKVAVDAEAVLESLADKLDMAGLEPAEQFKLMLAEVKKAAGLRVMAQQCANDAAPYMHPKLSSIEHTGKGGGPVSFTWLPPS